MIKQFTKSAVGSWKTTVVGFLIALRIVSPTIIAALDGDPSTIPDWNTAVDALLAQLLGLIARDNNVNDEQAGAPLHGDTCSHPNNPN